MYLSMNAPHEAYILTALHEGVFNPNRCGCDPPKLKLDYRAFGRQVADVCVGLQPGERVWINTWEHDTELSTQLALQCLKRGCPTLTTIQFDEIWEYSILEAPTDITDHVSAGQAAVLEETDVYIFTLGPRIIPWDKIPSQRRKLVTFWLLEKNRFVKEWKAIAKARKVRMLGIEATMATPERARTIGLDYEEWRQIMFDGCMADHRAVSKRAKTLEKLIQSYGEVRIQTRHGTDFTFKLDNRPADSFDGVIRQDWVSQGRPSFLPAGGIEVSVDEQSGNGRVVFDKPIRSLLREGIINRLTLTVSKGRIVNHSAGSQQQAFERWLKEGRGSVDRLAFFGFGLNPNLRHGFTQDDKVLGGVTIGFGDNSDKEGKNKADRGFWASMTGATVTIGNKHVMKDGKLLV
jgi:leucyl aminopeptidase (aminopeptidase T)